MTIELGLDTLCDLIGQLSVAGLIIKDLDHIPVAWNDGKPVLYPEPVGFVTNFLCVPASFGIGPGSQWDVDYDLTFTLLYAKAGTGADFKNYGRSLSLGLTFIAAIMSLETIAGVVDLQPKGLQTPGPVFDPSGQPFFGMRVVLHGSELIN